MRIRRSLVVTALAVLALVLSIVVAAPAQAADDSSITGLVLGKPAGGSASPLANGDGMVYLYHSVEDDGFIGDFVDSYSTDALGRFTASGLADGYYTIRAFDMRGVPDSQRFAEEYYDNGWSPYGALALHVQNGQALSLNDIVLEPAGWVTGTVTDADGNPVPNASVGFRWSASSGGYGLSVDANGQYDSRDGDYTDELIPGTYLVEVSAWGGIDDPVYRSVEQEVTVAAGQGTTFNAVLEEMSTATFTVVDPDGEPLAGAPVHIQVLYQGEWGPIQSGPHCTDDQGRYRFVESSAFVAYKAKFLPPQDEPCEGHGGSPARPDLVAEYFDDVYALEDATPITFGPGFSATQHTVELGPAQRIKPGNIRITGTPRVGETLTARPGSWRPAATVQLEYQWLRNGLVIPGATDPELELTEDLEDAWVGVRVTGSIPGEQSVDAEGWVGAGIQPAPAIRSVKPKIIGTAVTGNVLEADPGNWRPAGVSLAYQWLADGEPIAGATSETFTVTNDQVWQRISVQVTGSRTGSAPVVATSAKLTRSVGRLEPTTPTITGTARVGKRLTVVVEPWGPEAVRLHYQWLRDGEPIDGATKKNYKPTVADVAHQISVQVTGNKPRFESEAAVSAGIPVTP